jgi:phenylalanyl-tRNA synthetase beta chain
MNISLRWLAELVELPQLKTGKNVELFAQQITEHCFEVEKVHLHGMPHGSQGTGAKGVKFTNVFTALVASAAKHPNADRLRVVSLQVGDKLIEPVVCGAWNFEAGDTVVLALPGAFIPHNVHSDEHESFTLGTVKIRGVESQGMVCSAFELGLASEPELKPEILVLPKNTPHGKPLADVLGSAAAPAKSDLGAVLEVSLPPNRPDLYSHVGIAREISAALGLKISPRFKKLTAVPKPPKAKEPVPVAVKDTSACRAYTAVKLSVKVQPSPRAIQEKLLAIGLRPINNVVDITNLVMYEVGQPLHAFDAFQVQGGIVVRQAGEGERVVTIDHRQRTLKAGMLVIADREKVLAVAGIMGGAGSEISDATTEVILESANFEPVSIRKTSRALGLRTDGSGFWEKGLAPEQALIGVNLALDYLAEHAGAKVLAAYSTGAPATPAKSVAFTVDQVNSLLGSSYSPAHAKKILGAFGFGISGSGKMKASLPYYRQDVVNYADLAEEMLKVTGMNEMPKQPLVVQRHAVAKNRDAAFVDIKNHLCSLGFSEIQSYSFVSEADAAKVAGDTASYVKIRNPLSGDQAYLKQDLMIPVLKNIALNQKNFESFKVFELGKGYFGFGRERDFAAFAIADKHGNPELLLSHAKGAAESLVAKYSQGKKVSYHVVAKTSDVTILVGDMPIGTIKVAASLPLADFGVKYPTVYVQVEVKALAGTAEQPTYQPIARFPTIELDTSLVVDAAVTWKQIQDVVTNSSGKLVTSVEVFDAPYMYKACDLPEFHKKLAAQGKKNIAFRCVFASPDKTLTDSEISPVYAKILAGLRELPGAEIR